MVRVQFTAIRPKNKAINVALVVAGLTEYTRQHAESIVREVKKYPAWQPAEYYRTGELGRGWRIRPDISYDGIRFLITNRTRGAYKEYSGFVHGTNQLGYHGAHGWKRLVDHLNRPQFALGAQLIINKGLGI